VTSHDPTLGLSAVSDYTDGIVNTAKALKAKRDSAEQRARELATRWVERRVRGVRVLQVPMLAKIPWLVHGFSTRLGGVSLLGSRSAVASETDPSAGTAEDKDKVLSLGFAEWDTPENVQENRRRFQSAIDAECLQLVTLKQFHSDIVQFFDTPPAHPCSGDAAATNRPGLLLGVQTADCVPILLVDPEKRAVSAVHAGWRGTLQRIAVKAVGSMQMHFGTDPARLLAAVGPSISGCCYEVGTEVAAQFKAQFSEASAWFDELRTGDEPDPLQWLNMQPPGHRPPAKKVLLNLKKANRAQLLEAGLRAQNIFVSELCTACRRDLFFSYRREGASSGRLMSVIGLR